MPPSDADRPDPAATERTGARAPGAAPGAAAPLLPPAEGFEPGSVWVAGAGPGDPELLTLAAARALAAADAVVYDALVSPEALRLARPGALLEHAGKRGGKPSPTQGDITLRLIGHARAGRRVLRLKGGDPFIFGRGGEELAGLMEAGVPFRIVPGITAASGALAAAGIPMTHRDVNQCVAMVTGHDAAGSAPGALDWNALARAAPVLVFYMIQRQLPVVAERLLAAGRSPDEPAALLENATLPSQRIATTTLGRAVEEAERMGLRPPALLVVGETVRRRLVSPEAPRGEAPRAGAPRAEAPGARPAKAAPG